MALVFISHSSYDNEKTKNIAHEIENSGFEYIFLDFNENDGIKAGEEWEKRLYTEIKRSHAVIIILSPAWINSKWCFAEYTQARALGKEIIPIIIDHGDDKKVDGWIADNVQKSDLTKDKNVLTRVIDRIKEIALGTQKGFKWDKQRPPYPGLISFEEEDAAVFFGKDEDIRAGIEKLNAMRNKSSPKFLNIVAASGLGKSSLLKAGIIPKLKLSYKEKWIILPTFRPKQRPLYFFSILIAKYLNKREQFKGIYTALKGEQYQETLDDIITDIELLSSHEVSILFPVDQAEEFYSVADTAEKERFFEVLLYLLSKKENVFTVWTLRSDYLKELQTDKNAKSFQKYEDIFSLTPVSKEQISSIIKEPAYVAGIEVEETLVEKIKEDVKTTDALPLLALCLHELYLKHGDSGRLTLNDYHALSDVKETNPIENIIRVKADEAIAKYMDNEKNIKALKEAFIPHLVRVNTENDYTEIDYIKQAAKWDIFPANAHKLIDALVEARLLIKKTSVEETTVEISHEALMRKWPLLSEWLKESHEFLIGKLQLENALLEWKKTEDKKKNKALLSGIQLEKSVDWLSNYPSGLDEEEKEYIKASIVYDKEKKFNQFSVKAFVGIVLIIAIIVSFLYFRSQKEKDFQEAKLSANTYARQTFDTIQKLQGNLDNWGSTSGNTPLVPPKFRLPLDLASKSVQVTLKQDKYITPQTRNSLIKAIEYAPPWEAKLEHNNSIEAISWNDDQTQLATLDYDRNIAIWDMEKYEVIKKYSAKNIQKDYNDSWVINSSISWCGSYIFMLLKFNNKNTQTITLDINNGNLKDISPSNLNIEDSSCNKSTNQFAFISRIKDTCQLRISDINKPEKSYIFKKQFQCYVDETSLEWSPDGKFLATVGSGLSLWDAGKRKLLKQFPYRNVTWGSSSTELIATELNVTGFNVAKLIYDSHKDTFFEKRRLVYDNDIGDDIEKRTIKADVIKKDNGKILPPNQIVASPNLRWLAVSYGECFFGNGGSSCENISIQILNIETGKVAKVLFGHTNPNTSFLWNQNSNILISRSNFVDYKPSSDIEDKFVRVWKVYPLWNFNDWSDEIVVPFNNSCGIRWKSMNRIDVAVNPGDTARAFICRYYKGNPLISLEIKNKRWNLNGWNVDDSNTMGIQRADNNFSMSESVSDNNESELYWPGKNELNSEYNASMYYLDDYNIIIKNRQSNKEIKLNGHSDIIYSASWSKDDKRILTSSKDGIVRIFDALNGEELIHYDVNVKSGKSVVWSPDDKWIAVLTNEGKIKVLPAMNNEILIDRLKHLRQAAPSIGEGAEDSSTFLE